MSLLWLVSLAFLSLATAAKSSLSVLDFSYDPAYDSGTYASLDLDPKGGLPSSFSICTAVIIKAWTNGASTSMHIFKTIDQAGNDLISLSLNVAKIAYFKFGIQGENFQTLLEFPWIFPLDWIHSCMSIEQSLGRITLVVGGTLLENRTFEEIKTLDYSSISSIQIGEKFTGYWANFNIFSPVLSVEKMRKITSAGKADCEESGDFVSWGAEKWVLSGNGGTVKELEYAERACRRVSKMHIYHMEAMHTQAHCMELCQKLWGRSPPVRTQKDWERIMEEVTAIADNTSNIKALPNIRLAATLRKLSHWNETETLDNKTVKLVEKLGVWRDYYTGGRLDNFSKPWKPHHGNEAKTFLMLNTNQPLKSSWDRTWNYYFDMSCLCEYDGKYEKSWDHPPLLVLWGVEPCSVLRTKDYYAALSYSSKQSLLSPKDVFFVGGISTQIHYNATTKMWVLTDAASKVRAETRASKESYALGKRKWTISADNSNCHEGMTYTKELKLSGCHCKSLLCSLFYEQTCSRFTRLSFVRSSSPCPKYHFMMF